VTAPARLPGRRALLEQTATLLKAGRSVLLVGPPGVGKSAIISAIGWPARLVVDPLEHVTRFRAARIRRGMDRGDTYLAAACTQDRHVTGCVGRIAWRMTVVYVPPLHAHQSRAVLLRDLLASGVPRPAIGEDWLRVAARNTRGLPGLTHGLADAVTAHWRRSGELLSVPLGIARSLHASVDGQVGQDVHHPERESS